MAISASQRGTQDSSQYFIGDWDYVKFYAGDINALVADQHLLGSVADGSLELSREDYQHEGATFPRVVDFTAVTKVGMTFTGNLQELSMVNLRIALAQDTNTVGRYIYPGTSCSDSNNYGALKINRRQCQGAQQEIEVVFWKALASGNLTFGGGDEVLGVPVTFVAQDDRTNHADSPIGYIYLSVGV